MAYANSGKQLAQNKAIMNNSFHNNAQNFIAGAKKRGDKVQAEGDEIIAYPKGTENSMGNYARDVSKSNPSRPINIAKATIKGIPSTITGAVSRTINTLRGAGSIVGRVAKKVVTDPLNIEATDRIVGKAKR